MNLTVDSQSINYHSLGPGWGEVVPHHQLVCHLHAQPLEKDIDTVSHSLLVASLLICQLYLKVVLHLHDQLGGV